MLAPDTTLLHSLPASIEVLPKQVLSCEQIRALLPAGTRVYLTNLGAAGTDAEMLVAARHLQEAGCIAVPHIAARRIKNRENLQDLIGNLTEHCGVRDVLVIGGGVATPAGPYASTMDILETGLLDRFGIQDIAVAGHPEGSPDFSERVANEALRQKQAFAERTDAQLRIVTQFSFDPASTMIWVENLAKTGINVPVHLGVAGPAKFTTLIKYATLCGIGNSLSVLKKNAGHLLSLASGYSPESFVGPVEERLAVMSHPAIAQMHIFPFGGLEKSAEWLRKRGSW